MSELLLPVGNIKMCLAAIHNGANAIYVGMPGFNARGRSHDHEFEELKEIIETCHLYGVKVHIAFNILIFENEIDSAIEKLDEVVKLGPDAFIVQDIGLISLMKKRYPKLTIHGSTQMTVTNHEAIELLDDLSIERFVLGRENTIEEIEKIKSQTNKELEVFVHGALCVAYSGQCFTSESLGGRSANRGQCAQSCRFNYEIFVDGKKENLGNIEYLVSPKDLCGINEAKKLSDMGIDSLKVEGRLKSPEFVATVANSYQSALKGNVPTEENIKNMEIGYSRGFYTGWLHGVAHQELVDGKSKSHRGRYVGRINAIQNRNIVVTTDEELSPGDGLLFVSSENKETGSKVFNCKKVGNNLSIGISNTFNTQSLSIGDEVYINSSDKLKKSVESSMTNSLFQKKIPISIKIEGQLNLPLTVTANDGLNEVVAKSESDLSIARSAALTEEILTDALSKLGHTPYILTNASADLAENLFLHNKEIKALKQSLVSQLNQARISVDQLHPNEIEFNKKFGSKKASSPKLNILLRKKDQLLTVCQELCANELIDYIILDYEFGKDYFDSVKIAKEHGYKIAIATTRILKPFEYHNFRLIERCKPDAILVRNLGALNYFQDKEFKFLGDFSLNCANSQTYNYLTSKNLESICASYDLNTNQLSGMINNIDPSKLEITLHQYMPEFHMEHCVFAAFLSEGNSFRDCGKPCEKHEVHLKDMYGNRHEIKADQECRNTMFNAKASSTVKYVNEWIDSGISSFRFECLHEQPEELIRKIQTYLDLFSGKLTQEQAYKKLGSIESYGLGTGNISYKKSYKDRKKEQTRL